MVDIYIILAIVVVIVLPVSVIVLLIWVAAHGRRLREAESRIVDLQALVNKVEVSNLRTATPDTPTRTASAPGPGPWEKTEAAPTKSLGTPSATKAARGPSPSGLPEPDDLGGKRPSRPTRSGPTVIDRALAWLQVNWFYAAAAAALTLAGIFLVQYGAEQGLLPPRLRVIAAALFGLALIGGGEWLRRRFGDGEEVATAYLPSILSGSGVVTLFGAILGARHLYDLIGQGPALTGLSVVALGAIVLGWFHGPLLVAIGLLGGALAPFMVGGARGSDLRPLHGYFLLLTLVGLSVDAVRRWRGRWVSALALISGLGASTLLVLGAAETTLWHQLAVTAMALAAMTLPVSRLLPDHAGPMTLSVLRNERPAPEEAMAFVVVAVVSGLAVLTAKVEFWSALAMTVVLFAAVSVWAKRAWGLQDAALAPVAAVLAMLTLWPAPEGTAAISLALLAGGAMSVLALLRSVEPEATYKLGWSLAAVLIAPAVGLVLHLAWGAPDVLGAYRWALHALVVAAGLTFAATAWAWRDGHDRLRPSLAALIAVTLIAYALGQIVGEAALTASVALMTAGAAWLDRRFKLPLLSWFVALAAPFVFWRLMAVPGLFWHVDGPLVPALISMVGAVAGFALAALWLRRAEGEVPRAEPLVVAETAALGAFGFLVTVLTWRGLIALEVDTPHMSSGLTATIWLLLGWLQLVVWGRGGRMRWLRLGLAVLFGGLGLAALLPGLTVGNPIFNDWGDNRITGWPVINTLIPAYLVPALVLLVAWRDQVRRYPAAGWPLFAGVLGLALVGGWAVLVIRHFWQGPEKMQFWEGVSQPEMTTYTIALIFLGAGLFYSGVAKRSDLWRRAGTGVLAVTMLKVFLIDVWSLDGLLRVGALIALAVAMGGLAWLYRWSGGAAADGGNPMPTDPKRDAGAPEGFAPDKSGPDQTGPSETDPEAPRTDP
ncbi:Uncharacterized membrane protein [Jannaschia faecimaris]|uniref:Uncharacterized membrane protein n=1 Tax=Jannaschia faecimaris TaxID=1244108 RepID=A0A1H3LG18_9RHOB|nr:DUF2339 domain-containing protein [Jannaschia faecimaris]SDY62894.1 Uncharacterized membrane protein [Jannaschia faecimaris]